MRASSLLIVAVAIGAVGCSQTFVYEHAGSVNSEFRLVEKRTHRFKYVYGAASVEEQVKLLPHRQFSEAQEGHTGCWRFDTEGGQRRTVALWRIMGYADGTLFLYDWKSGTPQKLDPSEVKDFGVGIDDLREIVSDDPFYIEEGSTTISTKRVVRDEDSLRVTRPDGKEVTLSGKWLRVRRPTQPPTYLKYYGDVAGVPYVMYPDSEIKPSPIFGLDGQGHAYLFLRGRDEYYLDAFLSGRGGLAKMARLKTFPMSGIKRWEFDKEYGPWWILTHIGLALTLSGNDNSPSC